MMPSSVPSRSAAWTRCALVALPVLLASACNSGEPQSANQAAAPTAGPAAYASYAGTGRDRLCLGGSNADAAVVSYGEGDRNCLVRGRIEGDALVPNGDESCRIPITQGDGKVTIGTPPASCAFYCGPTASLEGKTFTRMETAEPLADIAGDPLC